MSIPLFRVANIAACESRERLQLENLYSYEISKQMYGFLSIVEAEHLLNYEYYTRVYYLYKVSNKYFIKNY